MRILPYFPVHEPPISGAAVARHLDAVALDAHPPLDVFVRLPIAGEFDDAPDALHLALNVPTMLPFRFIVRVTRGIDGGLFPHRREVLQVRMADGFDPSRAGTLRGGFLTNTSTDREPESKSPGELSAMLYGPRAT